MPCGQMKQKFTYPDWKLTTPNNNDVITPELASVLSRFFIKVVFLCEVEEYIGKKLLKTFSIHVNYKSTSCKIKDVNCIQKIVCSFHL